VQDHLSRAGTRAKTATASAREFADSALTSRVERRPELPMEAPAGFLAGCSVLSDREDSRASSAALYVARHDRGAGEGAETSLGAAAKSAAPHYACSSGSVALTSKRRRRRARQLAAAQPQLASRLMRGAGSRSANPPRAVLAVATCRETLAWRGVDGLAYLVQVRHEVQHRLASPLSPPVTCCRQGCLARAGIQDQVSARPRARLRRIASWSSPRRPQTAAWHRTNGLLVAWGAHAGDRGAGFGCGDRTVPRWLFPRGRSTAKQPESSKITRPLPREAPLPCAAGRTAVTAGVPFSTARLVA